MFQKFRLMCRNTPRIGIPSMTIGAFDIHGAIFPHTDPENVCRIPDVDFDPWLIRDCE
jgi:hypothetical protein